MTDLARLLGALLAPYADTAPGQAGRVVDVPPAVGVQLLALLPDDVTDVRLNISQPPMRWLVTVAADLDGRLVGSVVPGRGSVRIDGVQVPVAAARELAKRITTAWPGTADTADALAAAVAEAWPSWTAIDPTWTGSGTDLLGAQLPPEVAVIGLWWD